MLTATAQSSPTTPPRARSRRRRLRLLIAGLLVLVAVCGYLTVRLRGGGSAPEGCAASADGSSLELTLEQAQSAATIAAVAGSRGLPERAVTIALATAMQESRLNNIKHGDRDSVGLFQQRPSQGWGTVEQIMDPVYATGKFFDALVAIPGYSRLPLTVAAQRVQKSAYPQAYAKHEPDAALLTLTLSGRKGGALACTVHPKGGAAGPGDAAAVRDQLNREFAAKATTAGRTGVRVSPAEAGSETSRVQHGWAVAQWAVAQADVLGVRRVAYHGKVWTTSDSAGGWHPDSSGGSSSEVRISLAG